MPRFIVRYRGPGSKPAQVMDELRALPGSSILDTTDKMVLVEAEEHDLRRVLGPGHQWLIAPEQTYELPEKPPRVSRGT